MSDDIPPIILNANQRRHFEVLFARLEDSLVRIEALLMPVAARQQSLTIDEQDIPAPFREHAVPTLARLRDQIAQMATMLELRPRRFSRARAVAAMLSSEAIRIEDSLSSQLRGYGDVDPSVVEHLDPALMELAHTLSALASTLDHHSHSTSKR